MFDRLPEYPWQKLKPYQAIAEKHANGMVDLSVGSPVDPTQKLFKMQLEMQLMLLVIHQLQVL